MSRSSRLTIDLVSGAAAFPSQVIPEDHLRAFPRSREEEKDEERKDQVERGEVESRRREIALPSTAGRRSECHWVDTGAMAADFYANGSVKPTSVR